MCRWFDSAPGHQCSCAPAPFSGPGAFLQFGPYFYKNQPEMRVSLIDLKLTANFPMKLISEETSLVIAGAWNSAIVTPEWIQRYGLKKEAGQEISFQAMVPVGAGMLFDFPRFSFDGLSVVVRPDALVLAPSGNSEEKMDEIEQLAANAVAELKHTPVGGVGHNFGFCEDTPNVEALTAFTESQNALVAAAPDGWTVASTLLATTMIYGSTQVTVNRAVIGNRLTIKFNFHHAVSNGIGALSILRGEDGYKRLRENYQVARTIITQLYGDLDEH